jgi:hypothetical protein
MNTVNPHEAVVPLPSALPRRFEPHHPGDRNFILVYVLLIWLGIAMGFGPQIVRHIAAHSPPYPLIVHVHAAAFVGWLVLLSVQVWLIREKKLIVHRKLGQAGAVLAVAMVILGPAAAVVVQRAHFGSPSSDPSFLSVQLTDILAFAGLVTAAILFRKQAAAHKRLILLATLYISDAGFARWLGDPLETLLGDGFGGMMAQLYLANDLLIIGIGAYDLVTRHRLHRVYILGVVWIAALQLTAITLYLNPLWKSVAVRLLGH